MSKEKNNKNDSKGAVYDRPNPHTLKKPINNLTFGLPQYLSKREVRYREEIVEIETILALKDCVDTDMFYVRKKSIDLIEEMDTDSPLYISALALLHKHNVAMASLLDKKINRKSIRLLLSMVSSPEKLQALKEQFIEDCNEEDEQNN